MRNTPSIKTVSLLLNSHNRRMPTVPELIGLLIVVLVIWLVFKMVRFAIRLLLFFVAALAVAGAVWWFFVR
jgi:hypothetical protein